MWSSSTEVEQPLTSSSLQWTCLQLKLPSSKEALPVSVLHRLTCVKRFRQVLNPLISAGNINVNRLGSILLVPWSLCSPSLQYFRTPSERSGLQSGKIHECSCSYEGSDFTLFLLSDTKSLVRVTTRGVSLEGEARFYWHRCWWSFGGCSSPAGSSVQLNR